MRKISMYNMVSVDGFFADTNGGIDWHTVDEDYNTEAIKNFEKIDTIIFGRVTYDLFKGYWPAALKDPNTSDSDRQIAQFIEDAKKIVFSKSLGESGWNNTTVLQDIDPIFLEKLKLDEGKDMIVFGSGTIVKQFTEARLIDSYSFMVSPVILGDGKRLFGGVPMVKLAQTSVKQFNNGNVLLEYGLA